jgi:hypothetical protein
MALGCIDISKSGNLIAAGETSFSRPAILIWRDGKQI